MINHLMCCGVKEITRLQDLFYDPSGRMALYPAEHAMKMVLSQWYSNPVTRERYKTTYRWYLLGPRLLSIPGAHVIFNDAHERHFNYGWRFAKYIRQQGLGRLVCTLPRKNRNYAYVPGLLHTITTWVWTPYDDAVQAWCQNHIEDAWDTNGPEMQLVPNEYASAGLPVPFRQPQ